MRGKEASKEASVNGKFQHTIGSLWQVIYVYNVILATLLILSFVSLHIKISRGLNVWEKESLGRHLKIEQVCF